MRVGLLSDTHLSNRLPELWEEVCQLFRDVDLILHAGDIVAPGVLDWLEQFAPVVAAQGNNDYGWDDPRMAAIQRLDLEGWQLTMIHDIEPEERSIAEIVERELEGEKPEILFAGHTHIERLEHRDDLVLINSGSPTHPHLFSTRPGSVGLLELEPGRLHARIVRLQAAEGMRNPAQDLELVLKR